MPISDLAVWQLRALQWWREAWLGHSTSLCTITHQPGVSVTHHTLHACLSSLQLAQDTLLLPPYCTCAAAADAAGQAVSAAKRPRCWRSAAGRTAALLDTMLTCVLDLQLGLADLLPLLRRCTADPREGVCGWCEITALRQLLCTACCQALGGRRAERQCAALVDGDLTAACTLQGNVLEQLARTVRPQARQAW